MDNLTWMTLQLDKDSTDDPTYVDKVCRLISGALTVCSPESLSILRLDGWFGPRWLGFSHKVMGHAQAQHLGQYAATFKDAAQHRSDRHGIERATMRLGGTRQQCLH